MLTIMRSRRKPALVTRTSNRPNASMAVSINRWAPDQSPTSSPLATASPPAARIRSMTSPAGPVDEPLPSASVPRSLTTTLAPCRPNSNAWPRPIPRPAPVTMTTRPSHRPVIASRVPKQQSGRHRQLFRHFGLVVPTVDPTKERGEPDVGEYPQHGALQLVVDAFHWERQHVTEDGHHLPLVLDDGGVRRCHRGDQCRRQLRVTFH